MAEIGWRVKLGVVLTLVVAAGAALVVLLASGPSDAASVTTVRRALAAREAQRLITAVRLPGALPSADSGAGRGSAVAGLDAAAGPAVVRRSRSWTMPVAAARVRAFLAAHPPGGTRAAAAGSLTFLPVAGSLGLAAASLELMVLPTGPRASIVRAEAVVRWLVPRPPAERVPSGARRLVITRGPLGRAPSLVIRVNAPAVIARIRALLNGMAPVQPGRVYHCPAQFAQVPVVSFSFRGNHGGALALATQQADVRSPTTACDAMSFSVGGRRETPLLGGYRLLRQVSGLIGRRLWTPPYAA